MQKYFIIISLGSGVNYSHSCACVGRGQNNLFAGLPESYDVLMTSLESGSDAVPSPRSCN